MPVSCDNPSLESLLVLCIVSDDEVVHRDPLTAILCKKHITVGEQLTYRIWTPFRLITDACTQGSRERIFSMS